MDEERPEGRPRTADPAADPLAGPPQPTRPAAPGRRDPPGRRLRSNSGLSDAGAIPSANSALTWAVCAARMQRSGTKWYEVGNPRSPRPPRPRRPWGRPDKCSPASTGTRWTTRDASPSLSKFRAQLDQGSMVSGWLDDCLAIHTKAGLRGAVRRRSPHCRSAISGRGASSATCSRRPARPRWTSRAGSCCPPPSAPSSG